MTSSNYNLSWTVETIVSQVQRGGLLPSPGLSYRRPWSTGEMSKFIESVILDMPTGQIIACGPSRGAKVLVDGLRRVTALTLFTGGHLPDAWPYQGPSVFALSGLERCPELNGCNYKVLPDDSVFANCGLHLAMLTPQPGLDLGVIRQACNPGGDDVFAAWLLDVTRAGAPGNLSRLRCYFDLGLSELEAVEQACSDFGQWIGRVESELASNVEAEAYRSLYDAGVTPVDAVLMNRGNERHGP